MAEIKNKDYIFCVAVKAESLKEAIKIATEDFLQNEETKGEELLSVMAVKDFVKRNSERHKCGKDK